jgi:cyclophilin family peptidyl-prolyl cis-trans isomerase/HEAT repeat protein
MLIARSVVDGPEPDLLKNSMSAFSRCLLRPRTFGGAFLTLMALAACDDTARDADQGPPIPVHVPALPSVPSGGFTEGELELIRHQANRNAGALRAALDDPDPVLRARAALALASVQDDASVEALMDRLFDADDRVRANAAFALGQLDLPDGGDRLLEALAAERRDAASSPAVRIRILEAIGKRGGEGAVRLAAAPESEETGEERVARHFALARLMVRGVAPSASEPSPTPGAEGAGGTSGQTVLHALLEGLTDPDPGVREASAWAFGRSPDAAPWRDRLDRLRAALAGYEIDDPAAIHLITALGRIRDGADVPELARWLSGSADWRIRNIAAVAIGAREFVAEGEARDALRRAIESDPSTHVRSSAAQALAGLLPPLPDAELRDRASGPASDWRTQLPFVNVQAGGGVEPLLAWIGRLRDHEPVGVIHGLELLRTAPDEEVDQLLFELVDHPDVRVRRAAVGQLARRWEFGAGPLDRHAELFLRMLEAPDLPLALAAVEALGHPAFHPFGAVDALKAAWTGRHGEGPAILLGAILVALGESGDPSVSDLLEAGVRDPRPLVRMGAGEGIERLAGTPPRGLNLPSRGERVDPDRLRALGSEPRWILQTERGEIRIRLVPDQAPLTVLGVAGLAESGAYDGVPFHRVIGGFVAQGGDVAAGDGTGQAGLFLPSEFTLLPFVRGVVGMASSGKDTEDSQFFLVHAIQPHLDGLYTAFGWVEEGGEVMDRLLPGDLLLSSRIEIPTAG